MTEYRAKSGLNLARLRRPRFNLEGERNISPFFQNGTGSLENGLGKHWLIRLKYLWIMCLQNILCLCH